MADLKDIIGMRVPVTFDWNGTTIALAYRPYSERIEREIKGDDEWDADAMKRLLVRVVIDWDITSQGQPLPITEENLGELPTDLMFSLFYAVLNDLRDPKLPTVTRKTSDAI